MIRRQRQQHEDPRRARPFRIRLALARAAEAWEALWPALWPAVAVVVAFLAVSLFDLWAWLPGWLHAAGLLGFAAALAWALWQGRGAVRLPAPADGLRRMERASGLRHQALRAVGDRLSGGTGDAGTAALWRLHQERLRRALARSVRIGPPRSDLPRRDPWAVRAALLLMLVVAAAAAGGDAGRRLAAAFQPSAGLGEPAGPPPQLALWITPPDYTRRPPVLLEATKPQEAAPAKAEAEPAAAEAPPPLRVPEGSQVLAQLHHPPAGAGRVELTLGDAVREPFREVGEDSLEATLELRESGRLAVAAGPGGDELGAWTLEVVPDLPPEIAFAEPPSATHRAVLRTAYTGHDDYGVRGVGLLMSRPGGGAEPERLDLVRPRAGATGGEFADTSYLDLTRHPWAGLPVVLQLEAVDGVGQRGLSEPREIVLPARQFTHPVARAIIELRRRLAEDPERNREEVGAALNRLAQFPEAYQNDPAVFLALRSTAARLYLDQGDEATDAVMDTLWDTALHLEDGALSLAERRLRELQEALKDALANDASDAELERLMDELQQAMEDYLEELARQAMQNADQRQQMEQMPISPDQLVDRQELQEMLDMAREMLRTGAREAAQQMLSQLQEMLENLRMAQPGQMQQGQQTMGELQELIQRQQGLLDETFRMSQQGRQGQQGQQGQPGQQGQQQGRMGQPGGRQPGTTPGQAAGEQEALRRALGDLMRGLGEQGMQIPRALGQAELAMRDATGALERGQPGQAVDPQGQALDLLREGGRALMDEMRQMMGQGQQGQQPGQQPGIAGRDRRGRDPLGRPLYNQGNADLWGEFVPDQLDLGRARAILEELYRRASQRNRPPEELDYIERLLDRF